LPNILKVIWSEYLENVTSEELKPYERKKHYNVNIIDVIRLSHANPQKNQAIKDLVGEMKNSSLKGKGKIRVNLVSSTNTKDDNLTMNYAKLNQAIKDKEENQIIDNLEENIEISFEQMESLIGDTVCLCDNSGSIKNNVKIGNLMNFTGFTFAMKTSSRGTIGLFGDKLFLYNVYNKQNIIQNLKRFNELSNSPSCKVGDASENGLWLFFEQAFKEPELNHYENLIIFSDKQAAYGKLFGIDPEQYSDFRWNDTKYIDLLKLIEKYRQLVNRKVNVYIIDFNGNNNNIHVELYIRTCIISGYTGKEIQFMNSMNRVWNDVFT
jgi:hypothetical protein